MKVGKIVRAIAILSHPLPGTDNAQSAQIIVPQKQVQLRLTDMLGVKRDKTSNCSVTIRLKIQCCFVFPSSGSLQ